MSGSDESSNGITIDVVDKFRPRSDLGFVRCVVKEVLGFVGCDQAVVALLLTDDAEIAGLHGQFLDDPTPTDVMSFADDDSIDVVVSVECARREAQRHGHAIRTELALYVVHGLLHAFGYDDHAPEERRVMRDAERQVMARLELHIASVDADEMPNVDVEDREREH